LTENYTHLYNQYLSMNNRTDIYIRKLISITVLTVFVYFSVDYLNNEYYETSSNLHLRVEPSVTSQSVTIIPSGSPVTVLSQENDGWYMIRYDDTIGYSSSLYIEKSEFSSIGWKLFHIYVLFPITIIPSGLIWRFRLVTSTISLLYGFLGFEWLYLGKPELFGFVILELVTLSPSVLLLGFINSVTFISIPKKVFDKDFNGIIPLKRF
jgi:hypothetical protein